jgi:hypothetical protein
MGESRLEANVLLREARDTAAERANRAAEERNRGTARQRRQEHPLGEEILSEESSLAFGQQEVTAG